MKAGLLAAAHTKTLIGAYAIRCEAAPEGRLAAEGVTDPTAALPNPGIATGTSFRVSYISLQVSEPVPAPFPYIT